MRNIQSSKGFTLIEILVVIGIIAVLAAIVLIAINPARQFRVAHDTQRKSNVNAILNAIGQYTVDAKGTLPTGIPKKPAAAQEIGSGGGKADLCSQLIPKYMPALPADPKLTTQTITDCSSYTTGYKVVQDTDANGNRVTVSADGEEPVGTDNISVTR